MSDPWMKFYPSDWRSDPKLRLVSMAARGLWMEMICLMHEAEPYGELRVADVPLDAAKLARLVGEPVENVETWLSELQSADVYSVRKNGVIFSRRMEKDENRRRKLRENGKKGGNPALRKDTGKSALDNQGDKTQKPEARSQKLEKDSSLRSESARDHPDLETAWDGYCTLAPRYGWAVPRELSKARRKALNSRLKEHGLDGWGQILRKARGSQFLRGETSAQFKLTIDWLLKPANILKTLEGNYDDKPGHTPSNSKVSSASARRHAARDDRFDAVLDRFENGVAGQGCAQDDGADGFDTGGGGSVIELDPSQFSRVASSNR